MPIYQFHIRRPDPAADASEAHDLRTHADAAALAFWLLETGTDALFLEVWCEGRRLLIRQGGKRGDEIRWFDPPPAPARGPGAHAKPPRPAPQRPARPVEAPRVRA